MWLSFGYWEGVFLNLLFGAVFVGSLYIWPAWRSSRRDDPRVLIRRMVSVAVVCVVCPLLVWHLGSEVHPLLRSQTATVSDVISELNSANHHPISSITTPDTWHVISSATPEEHIRALVKHLSSLPQAGPVSAHAETLATTHTGPSLWSYLYLVPSLSTLAAVALALALTAMPYLGTLATMLAQATIDAATSDLNAEAHEGRMNQPKTPASDSTATGTDATIERSAVVYVDGASGVFARALRRLCAGGETNTANGSSSRGGRGEARTSPLGVVDVLRSEGASVVTKAAKHAYAYVHRALTDDVSDALAAFIGSLTGAQRDKHHTTTDKDTEEDKPPRNNSLLPARDFSDPQVYVPPSQSLILIRNVVFAPVSEELVFRACGCAAMLATGAGMGSCVWVGPLCFALAHAHHVYELVKVSSTHLS